MRIRDVRPTSGLLLLLESSGRTRRAFVLLEKQRHDSRLDLMLLELKLKFHSKFRDDLNSRLH